jgi:hypothetical protein
VLVERELRSGLVAVEQSGDEAQISRALKQIDERYVLQKHPAEIEGGWVYKVFCIVSEDQPAICIHTWCDDRGNPLPLSSGLIEDVKRWRPESRERRGFDADEHNRQVTERLEKEREADIEAVSSDHKPWVERNRVTVSLGPTTKVRYWRRNLDRPAWMRR